MIKPFVKQLLFHSGGLAPFRSLHSRQVIILMYHRIYRETDPFFPGVSERSFLEQIHYVHQHYRVTSLSEVIQRWNQREDVPSNTLVVTFDDGYENNCAIALPILQRFHVPAMLYVAVDPVRSSVPVWTDSVRWLLKLTKERELALRLNQQTFHWKLDTVQARILASQAIGRMLKTVENQERLEALRLCADKLRVSSDQVPKRWMLNWEQILQMRCSGVDIGAHTMTHPILSRVALPEAEREIGESKQYLEQKLGASVLHFAYPNGEAADFTEDTQRIVRAVGFHSACSTIFGWNDATTDRFALRRIYAREEPLAHFALRLAGLGG